MVNATRRFEFSAAHRYWRNDWTPDEADTGMMIDLVAMDASVRNVLDQLDFHHIDREIAAFTTKPSTAENIVVYLWDKLAPSFEGKLRQLKLWETRKNVFAYAGPSA